MYISPRNKRIIEIHLFQKLVQKWRDAIDEKSDSKDKSSANGATVNVAPWLPRATLDALGDGELCVACIKRISHQVTSISRI